MMRTVALLLLPMLLASCGTTIRIPDSIFAENPRKRVVVGGPQNPQQQGGQPRGRHRRNVARFRDAPRWRRESPESRVLSTARTRRGGWWTSATCPAGSW